MASTLPLNVFRTITWDLSTSLVNVYTAPVGVTSIVLMAQISNIDTTPLTHQVTAAHYDGTTATNLVMNFPVAYGDASSVLTGKLILEAGQSIQLSCDSYINGSSNSNDGTSMQAVLSILETSSQ